MVRKLLPQTLHLQALAQASRFQHRLHGQFGSRRVQFDTPGFIETAGDIHKVARVAGLFLEMRLGMGDSRQWPRWCSALLHQKHALRVKGSCSRGMTTTPSATAFPGRPLYSFSTSCFEWWMVVICYVFLKA